MPAQFLCQIKGGGVKSDFVVQSLHLLSVKDQTAISAEIAVRMRVIICHIY
jgi:hypothetical protein